MTETPGIVLPQERGDVQESNTEEEPRINGTDEERAEASQRVAACAVELRELLHKHNCRITAFIAEPEAVGRGSSRIQLTAQWGIEPMAG